MTAPRRESGCRCGTTRDSLSPTPLNKTRLVLGEKCEIFSFQLNEQAEREGRSGVAEQADDYHHVEKWKKERQLLIDVFTVKKSTGESEFRAGAGKSAGDFGHTFGQMSWDQGMKFYLEPGHRRPGLKWVQTTNETEHVFKAFRLGDHLRELAKQVREGLVEKEVQRKPYAIGSGFRREGGKTQTLWAPRIPKAISHEAVHHDSNHDHDVQQKLDAVVTKKLQELYESPRKRNLGDREDLTSEQGKEIDCDPDTRCETQLVDKVRPPFLLESVHESALDLEQLNN